MVRQTDQYGTATLSSIALLQERFRQLEKMKEMRQEKALLRILSESSSPPRLPATMHSNHQPVRVSCFSYDQFPTFATKPDCQLSLSLFPDSSIYRYPSFPAVEVPNGTISSWIVHTPALARSSSIKMDNSDTDIDTSLRL